MSHVIYKVVQHDGGWAYTVDGVFSEPFPTHAAALAAARRAANEQRVVVSCPTRHAHTPRHSAPRDV